MPDQEPRIERRGEQPEDVEPREVSEPPKEDPEELARREREAQEKLTEVQDRISSREVFPYKPPQPVTPQPVAKEKGLSRAISAVFNGVSKVYLERAYRRFADILKDQNDPTSDNYFRKQITEFNSQQEAKAEARGFDQRYAFIGHLHSRGTEDWKDGSDGSLTAEEIYAEAKAAQAQYAKQGYQRTFVVLTDHNAVGNSLKVAEMLRQDGEIEPVVGVEVALKEGFEVLLYTTDPQALQEFYDQLKDRLGAILRFAKSGITLSQFKEIIDQIGRDRFTIGIPHPTAAKSIVFGGTLPDRLKDPKEGPLLREFLENYASFYEAQNWYQNPYGSNCLAWSLREQMQEMGLSPFALPDFHSHVQGTENLPFNGLFTELRTDRQITSGGDLLGMIKDQDSYVPLLVGEPASSDQYKEHLKNNRNTTIKTIITGLLEKIGIKI